MPGMRRKSGPGSAESVANFRADRDEDLTFHSHTAHVFVTLCHDSDRVENNIYFGVRVQIQKKIDENLAAIS